MENNTSHSPKVIEMLEKAQDRIYSVINDINTKQDQQIGSLSNLGDRLSRMDKLLAIQSEQLRIHIKRSDALEESVDLHRRELELRLHPVESFVTSFKVTLKVLGIICTTAISVAALIAAVIKIF